jgi:hypothetical protein
MAKKVVKYQTKSAVTPKKTFMNQNRSAVTDILKKEAKEKSGMPTISGINTAKDLAEIKRAMKGQARADAIFAGMQAYKAKEKKVDLPTKVLNQVQGMFSKKKGGTIKKKK